MKIEILYFDGCPNHPRAVELVRRVVRDLGIEPEIETVEVSEKTAERLRFLGSPTIRVDGKDIEPAARGRTHFAMSCRMYGSSGVPPRELLETALAGGEGA